MGSFGDVLGPPDPAYTPSAALPRRRLQVTLMIPDVTPS
jgi:hypothetical protein